MDLRRRFGELLQSLADERERSFAFAELNDLLTELTRSEFPDAVSEAPGQELSDYLQNYVAAMVEQAAHQKGVSPPAWVDKIKPLDRPHFGDRV